MRLSRAAWIESPLYCGVDQGNRFPRYCPSIEDKVVASPTGRDTRSFWNPMAGNTAEIYPNGSLPGLPLDIQIRNAQID